MKNSSFSKLIPALGLIIGAGLGLILAIIANLDLALFIGAGAGIGLVLGSIISLNITKK